MSVDTNVNGKNLAAYRRIRHDDFRVLVTPTLVGLAESMRVVTGGPFGRSLRVELRPRTDTDDGENGDGDAACPI